MSAGRYIVENINRPLLYAVLILCVLGITYTTINYGYIAGAALAVAPVFILYLMQIIDKPIWGFITMFVMNYYVSGLSRYVKAISPGIFMDIILAVTIASLILQLFRTDSTYHWKKASNKLTFLAFIWFLYCLSELLNPEASPVGWLTAVRGIGVYFLVIVVITSIVLRKFKDLKTVLLIWAVLSLTAVLKAFIQKTYGFDAAEMYWLYVGGGSKTHIIYSGIRYFSFFTDAANFGTGIAFSGVVFCVAAIYTKNIRLKIFYFFTFAACMYGMIISGTRGSVAVPFIGFTLLAILSKDWRIISLTTAVIILGFLFLKYTNYGNGNSYVRRMRSVFSTEDASLQVRLENQRKLKTYMSERPFGVGIGMSRGRATTYRPNDFLIDKPNDSWYVMIWVETGIVGLILHISILISILFYGIYLVLFKLKDRELKGIVTALLCGISGLYVASYSIEIMGQFPTAFILYTAMACIFLSPGYDKEIAQSGQTVLKKDLYYYELES